MQRDVIIKHVCPSKSGTSERGSWTLTDVVCEWTEHEPNCSDYTQAVVVTVSGYPNNDELERAMRERREVTLRFYLDVRFWQDRVFQSVRGNFNGNYFTKEPIPQPL